MPGLLCLCVCVCVRACVRVCVCVRERERILSVFLHPCEQNFATCICDSYTMGTRALPDIYTLALRQVHIYQAQSTSAHGITNM